MAQTGVPMRTEPEKVSVLPAEWTAMLDGIQAALHEALGQAEERERMLSGRGSSPAAVFPGLEQLADRMRRLQAGFEEAEREAGETDAFLQQGQQVIQTWQAAAESLRQRLAK
jgi:hypothetical protein